MATRKKKQDSAAESDQPSFEEALEQLESLVEAMENDQLPLEELVANYEKGSKLMSHCQSVLESARERIELITLENQGDSGLENEAASNDAEAAPASSDTAQGDSQEDDIRLL